MATSEDLMPKGLPQGERQNQRAGRQQAGLRLASSPGQAQGGRPSPGGQQQGPGGALGLLLGNTPEEFPFLGDEQPTQEAAAPVSESLMVSGQSGFAQAVSARLAQP